MKKSVTFCFVIFCFFAGAAFAQIEKADTFYNKGDYYSALPIYQELSRQMPSDYALKYKVAQCYEKINNFENAVDIFKDIISNNNSIVALNSYKGLANYYLSRNLYRDVEQLLLVGISKFSAERQLYENLLFVQENLGKYESALALLDNPIFSRDQTYYRKKITYLLKLKKKDEALSVINDNIGAGRDKNFWLEEKAYYLRNLLQFNAAEAIYMDLYANTSDIYYIKECGFMYVENQDRKNAVRAVSVVIKEKNLNTYLVAAGIMKDLTLYDELITFYLNMRKLFPGSVFYQDLISLYDLTSRYPELISEYMDSLKVGGDFNAAKEKITDVAVKMKMTSMVTSRLSSVSEGVGTEMKSYVQMILYNIALKGNDRTSAYQKAKTVTLLGLYPDFDLKAVEEMTARGWFKEARALLENSVKAQKDPVNITQALLKMSAIDQRMGNTASAMKILDEIESGYDRSKYDVDKLCYYRAECLTSLGQYEKALEQWTKIKNKNGETFLQMALESLFMDDYKNALEYVRKASSEKEFEARAKFIEGTIYIVSGDRVKALDSFGNMAKNWPQDEYAVQGLVEFFILKNVFDENNEKDQMPVYGKMKKMQFAGHYKEALEPCGQLGIKNTAYSYMFDYQTGMLYYYLNDLENAMIFFNKVVSNPKALMFFKSFSLEKTADLLYDNGRYNEALEYYRKLMTGDPQFAGQHEVRKKINELKNR